MTIAPIHANEIIDAKVRFKTLEDAKINPVMKYQNQKVKICALSKSI